MIRITVTATGESFTEAKRAMNECLRDNLDTCSYTSRSAMIEVVELDKNGRIIDGYNYSDLVTGK